MSQAYCLTLARGLTPALFLERLGAQIVGVTTVRGADATEATFALAEYLTGVRLTSDLLDESVYLCGVAPVPQA